MRSYIASILVTVCVMMAARPSSAQTKDTFPLASVIAEVKKELLAAQNTPGQTTVLPLQNVQ